MRCRRHEMSTLPLLPPCRRYVIFFAAAFLSDLPPYVFVYRMEEA